MATILLSAVRIFCGVPAAPLVGSVLAALLPISPVTIISFVSWYLAIRFSKAKWIQRFKGSTKTMLKYALMLHLMIMVPIYAILIFFACKAV